MIFAYFDPTEPKQNTKPYDFNYCCVAALRAPALLVNKRTLSVSISVRMASGIVSVWEITSSTSALLTSSSVNNKREEGNQAFLEADFIKNCMGNGDIQGDNTFFDDTLT